MIFHLVQVLVQAPLLFEFPGLHSFLLLIPLLVRLQVEHLHDAIVREITVFSEKLLDKNLEPFEACACLQDIDGCSEDVDGNVNHGTAWEETGRMINKVALS